MPTVLHIPALPGAKVACDMSTATDSPDQRLGAYRRLFERALVRRERRDDGVLFAFRAAGGTQAAVVDLARREAACCPFLDYRIETIRDEVVWTTTSAVTGDERASVDATLDAFHALPDDGGSDFAGLLADRGARTAFRRG
jgi:hypothetical protein